MSESDRVQRWRQRQREAGKDAWTIWVPRELKLYIEDIALKRHCSPSDLIEQALTTCYPLSAHVADTVTDTTVADTSQIRSILQQELRAFFSESQPYQDMLPVQTVADTVTDTPVQAEDVRVAATRARHVTDTVTDTVSAPTGKRKAPSRQRPVTANVSDTISDTEPKHRGRKPVLRPGILALLDEHTQGLTATELKVYLGTEKPIGDTLAGMVKAQLLVKLGTGQGLRYHLASPEAD